MLIKSMRKESLYIADMLIYHNKHTSMNKHISTAYCTLCMGINGMCCQEVLIEGKGKAICMQVVPIKRVSKYAN